MKEFKSFYKTVGSAEGARCKYPTRLDTYGCGCYHDCGYCYAKSLLDFRGLWNPLEPRVADLKKIERKLDKIPAGSVLRLGGMTDCFQPCERTYKVTYETIKLLNERGIGYLIVTKSDLVAEYRDILRPDLAHIQVSITSLGQASYEKAVSSDRRIEAVLALQDEYDAALRVSPLIPGRIDFDRLNATGVRKVVVEFLRVNSWVEKWLPGDYSDFTERAGGYKHLPLDKKIDLVQRITLPSLTVCEDVPEHYIYWRDHVNPNPDDCCNLRLEKW